MPSKEGKTEVLSHSKATENEQDLFKVNATKVPNPGSGLPVYYTVNMGGGAGGVGWVASKWLGGPESSSWSSENLRKCLFLSPWAAFSLHFLLLYQEKQATSNVRNPRPKKSN